VVADSIDSGEEDGVNGDASEVWVQSNVSAEPRWSSASWWQDTKEE